MATHDSSIGLQPITHVTLKKGEHRLTHVLSNLLSILGHLPNIRVKHKAGLHRHKSSQELQQLDTHVREESIEINFAKLGFTCTCMRRRKT